ncbi:activating transcription factor of chaperone isoform X2 [Agrilus planipennis]|uniref:Activating transcription factor of chaperone isoform X2 n=1 Tax=Agrilus planipennis TaxID=224129 RepID=A0A1W4XPL2_AGRPL|nr:activating transcription factor of chaperone isoform X2 [Agrilus planipennis]
MAVCYEPFVNWLEDKSIPIFEDVGQSTCSPTNSSVQIKPEQHINNISLAALQSDTQTLLQEFETIFDQVEMTHVALTPPHSPQDKSKLHTLLPIHEKQVQNFTPPVGFIVHPQTHIDVNYHNVSPPTPQLDVDYELAEVEELVRTRVQDMVHSPLSPTTSSSNFGDCSSDDPEWTPELTESPQLAPALGKFRESRRQKPYARASNEDKKSRKKEQNKNAATRYRLKKKAEIEEILEEERNLAKKRGELDNQIIDLKREIKYLKGLMRDLFKAKGLMK